MKRDEAPAAAIESDGTDVFVVIEGVGRIAKRGRPNTPYAKRWISLVPGWHVTGVKRLVVTRSPAETH